MVYHGHIKAGRIELTEPTALPEGAAVRVEVVLLADVEKTADDSSLCEELSQPGPFNSRRSIYPMSEAGHGGPANGKRELG